MHEFDRVQLSFEGLCLSRETFVEVRCRFEKNKFDSERQFVSVSQTAHFFSTCKHFFPTGIHIFPTGIHFVPTGIHFVPSEVVRVYSLCPRLTHRS